jgi:hypothetical protein
MPLLLLLLITPVLAVSVKGQSSAIALNNIAPKDTMMHSMNPLDIKNNMDVTAEERLMVIEDFLEKIHRGVEDLGLCTLISFGYSYQIICRGCIQNGPGLFIREKLV